MTKLNPFRYFKTSPEIIRLAVMMYVRFPLSLRNVEDLLHERGIDICHETVRYWWNKFGPMFAGEIRKNDFILPGIIPTGDGIWMKFLSKSMAKHITCGVPSTTKEKCWKPLFPSDATAKQQRFSLKK